MKIIVSASLVVAAVAADGVCDIFAAGKTPCVAAHSTVRALYSNFNGNLYQVLRSSDKTTKEIPTLSAGGFANSAVQDGFCKGTDCTINRIYDQSPKGNHLHTAPPGGAHRAPDTGVNATAEKLMVGGHPVYAAKFQSGNGYRNDKTAGIAINDEPETMYMVTSGKHYNDRCCFDYGNAETDDLDDGAGTMEAVHFGSDFQIQHDFVTAMIKGDVSTGPGGVYTEGVDYGGNGIAPCGFNGCVLPKNDTHLDCEIKCNATSGCHGYVFADASCSGKSGPICWIKGTMGASSKATCRNSRVLAGAAPWQPGHWAIKGGDAQTGKLKVYWDGKRAPQYSPMKKQGAIILGIGGDNSDGAIGTFYEGVMTQGYSSDATDDAVQANIIAAGYKEVSGLIVV